MRFILPLVILALGCAEGVVEAEQEGEAIPAAAGPKPDNPDVLRPNGNPDGQSEGPSQPGQPQAQQPATILDLEIREPVRGARVSGPSVRVAGRVLNATGPATVTIGGQSVAVDAQGSFLAEIAVPPGLRHIETTVEAGGETTDDWRAVLVDADADPRGEVAQSMKVSVSANGLAFISRQAEAALQGADLSSLLGGNADLGDVEVRSLNYNSLGLELVPGNGVLELRLRLYGFRIELGGNFSGRASANPAEFVAHLQLGATPAGGLDMRIVDGEAHLHDFDMDLDGVGPIIELIIDGLVREFAEDAIGDALTSMVIPQLFDPAALNQEIDLLGTIVDLGMKIRSAGIGANSLDLELAATANPREVVHPGTAVRPEPGIPTLGSADVDLALSGNFIGRILHAAWASGALDFNLDENAELELPVALNVGFIAQGLGPAGAGIDPQTPLRLSTRPLLPPTAHVEVGDKPIVVNVGDLLLDFASPDGPLVTVALNLIIRVGIDFENEGALAMEVEAHVDVAETPRGPVNARQLEQSIVAIAGLVPGLLAGAAENEGADPVPGGFDLSGAAFEADEFGPFIHVKIPLGP